LKNLLHISFIEKRNGLYSLGVWISWNWGLL